MLGRNSHNFRILSALTSDSYGPKLCASVPNLVSAFQKVHKNFCTMTGSYQTCEFSQSFLTFMKFISGRRILPYRSRMQKSNAKIQSVLKMRQLDMLLKMQKSFDY